MPELQRIMRTDGWLKVTALAMMTLGVVMVYSAGSVISNPPGKFFSLDKSAASQPNAPEEKFVSLNEPAGKQLFFSIIAFGVLYITGGVNYHLLEYRGSSSRWPTLLLYLAALGMLVAVLIPGVGTEVNGARRWLKAGPMTFQPSEFAKYAVVLFIAARLAWSDYPRKSFFRGLMPLVLVVAVACGLVAKEDLGTAALIALVSGMLFIAGGIKFWQLALLAFPAVAAFVGLIIFEPYRMDRITSFLHPDADPAGKGYHAIQSLIAIGSGSWWGVGLGNGIQKLGYLPEDTTDFIFSIICEELGLPGAVLVIALVMVMTVTGWVIYRHSDNVFGRLVTFGVIATIGFQSVINIAVATVSVPTKGIALPFISAGGSGMVFTAAALGLVCSVAYENHRGRKFIITEDESA